MVRVRPRVLLSQMGIDEANCRDGISCWTHRAWRHHDTNPGTEEEARENLSTYISCKYAYIRYPYSIVGTVRLGNQKAKKKLR